MKRPLPQTQAPDLQVKTVKGKNWTLSAQHPDTFTMLVFYRGVHCPVCETYLKDLEKKLDEFTKKGVGVIALSGDDEERASTSKEEWGLKRLTLGYGLSVETMRQWGLYISKSIKESEPSIFCEPGVFWVRPDGELYSAVINSMPFGRPSFTDLLSTLDWVIDNKYPARGEA